MARLRLTKCPLPLCSLVNPKSGEESRKLLDKLHGVAQPGRLLALMGSSGAGKTTLLNALAGQVCVRRTHVGDPRLTPRALMPSCVQCCSDGVEDQG